MLQFILFLAGSLFVFERLTRKFSSDSFATLDFYVGKKGSGKTTILTAEAIKYLKQGKKVYSTTDIPGCYTYDPKDIGRFDFEPGSVILIDEIQSVFNNRRWTDFDDDKIRWFTLQRHYKNKVIIATQATAFEKTIRDLVDHIFIVKKLARIFILARPVSRSVDINNSENGDDVGGQIVFKFRYAGLPKIYLLPLYTPFFDSFAVPGRKMLMRAEKIEMDEVQAQLMTFKGVMLLYMARFKKFLLGLPNALRELFLRARNLKIRDKSRRD